MKKFVAVASVLAAFFTVSAAQAGLPGFKPGVVTPAPIVAGLPGGLPIRPQPEQPLVEYTLQQFDISAKSLMLKNQEFQNGYVSLDLVNNKMVVNLYPKFDCGHRTICPMVMPAPVVVELPIVSVNSGICGGLFVHAVLDQRPVDGIKIEVQLSQTGHNTCVKVADEFADKVSITFSEQSLRMKNAAVSTFEGSELVRYYAQGTH